MYQIRTKTPMLHFRSTQNKTNLNNYTEICFTWFKLVPKMLSFSAQKNYKDRRQTDSDCSSKHLKFVFNVSCTNVDLYNLNWDFRSDQKTGTKTQNSRRTDRNESVVGYGFCFLAWISTILNKLKTCQITLFVWWVYIQ